jgi:hypothetical protein
VQENIAKGKQAERKSELDDEIDHDQNHANNGEQTFAVGEIFR